MLIPLTDSTNPFAAMMLELIRTQHAAVGAGHEPRPIRATVSRPKRVRGLFSRFRAGRRHAPVTSPA